MRQYKQTIRSPLHIILKKYLLFYALPLLVLLPIATKAVISTIPHVPEYSGSLLSLYIHCYTGKFLFFAIPTLIFLAMVAYSNNSHPIEIRNNILILPIQTGSCIGKNAATLVPLQDIISIETKSLHEPLPEKSHLNQEEEEVKEYLISCPGYLGDWMVVEFNRPK
ncbi:MAG: hypothetical protein U9R69_01855, partial [Thermodesulfobacteriota bacterium]|nr:hypothetical protein [Thermodesulfobacteriota bacterium]